MSGERATGFVIFKKVANLIEYLLLQTSYGVHHWTPPKGHVEPGESDLETAFRETNEEAGVLKEDLIVYDDAKKTLVYNVNGKPKTVIYWLAQLKNPNKEIKLSNEHQDYKWCNLEEAFRLGEYKETKELLQFCDDYIKKNLNK